MIDRRALRLQLIFTRVENPVISRSGIYSSPAFVSKVRSRIAVALSWKDMHESNWYNINHRVLAVVKEVWLPWTLTLFQTSVLIDSPWSVISLYPVHSNIGLSRCIVKSSTCRNE